MPHGDASLEPCRQARGGRPSRTRPGSTTTKLPTNRTPNLLTACATAAPDRTPRPGRKANQDHPGLDMPRCVGELTEVFVLRKQNSRFTDRKAGDDRIVRTAHEVRNARTTAKSQLSSARNCTS